MNSADAQLLLVNLAPLAVIAFVLWALAKWGHVPMWALLLALVLGVVLSGSILGPDIHQFLSQLSGGHLR